jgi:hypothetical protein
LTGDTIGSLAHAAVGLHLFGCEGHEELFDCGVADCVEVCDEALDRLCDE